MSKHFRPWNIDQTLLLPPNVRDFVPKDHVSRFIVGLVRESLDLKAIMCSYVSGLGQPPFDPRMMVSLLLHGYASGLYSSRRIARACCERNDFVMIVALDPPDFRTISDFRKRHLKALGELFLQVLKLCETAGLVKLGHVALDGTKIKANASKHKAMSYERMKKREKELAAEVERWLTAAVATNCRTGWPTSRSSWRRSGRPRRSWRRKPRLSPTRRSGGARRRTRSARRRAARRAARPPHRPTRSRHPRRSATSPIPRVASSRPRTATSRATMPRPPSMVRRRSSSRTAWWPAPATRASWWS